MPLMNADKLIASACNLPWLAHWGLGSVNAVRRVRESGALSFKENCFTPWEPCPLKVEAETCVLFRVGKHRYVGIRGLPDKPDVVFTESAVDPFVPQGFELIAAEEDLMAWRKVAA